jgi:AcrR family transcriptional regulator
MDESMLSKGERTGQAILDAAERLILSQGYHGTSMRQIASAVGIAVGGIYNHFDGKEAIFQALLERHQPYSNIVAALSGLSGESAAELVERAAHLMIDVGLADPGFIRLVFIDLQEFGGDTVFQLAQQMIQGLMTFFGGLVASGELRQDLPMSVLVRFFAGLVTFYILSEAVAFREDLPWAELPVSFDGEIDWVGEMVDLYLHGALKADQA